MLRSVVIDDLRIRRHVREERGVCMGRCIGISARACVEW
jgi:hypothetical protein